MPNMTFAVPEELHQLMSKHRDIRWSEVARQALWERARTLELMNKLLVSSKMNEKDALELGKLVNKGVAKRHGLIL